MCIPSDDLTSTSSSLNGNVPTFEDFVYEHDALFYGESPRTKQGSEEIEEVQSSIHGLSKFVTLRVINHFDSVQALHSYLDDLDLLNPDRLRPSWDTYFMVRSSPLLFPCDLCVD